MAIAPTQHALTSPEFDEVFDRATGSDPFPFQRDFACGDLPALVDVPTGLGKTAMAVLGWLWRRRFASDTVRRATPRRLVYCLPMRVLVEQTRDNAIRWLHNIGQLAGQVAFEPPLPAGERATDRHRVVEYAPPSLDKSRALESDQVAVHVLMGGEDEPKWDIHPERDAIIIGTQDMLLSRALNRGYAASRARWPMHFGLLNTDCLWVFDEIQLMGSGLATTAQLEAFRGLLPNKDAEEAKRKHGCASVWMSATLRPDWLWTVDFKSRIDSQGRIDGKTTLSLSNEEKEDNHEIKRRWNAMKPLSKVKSVIDPKGAKPLAAEVIKAHGEAKGRTIVVVNAVKRACDLWAEIQKQWSSATDDNLVLIHSRFRPPDRAAQIKKLRPEVSPDNLPSDGMIVVSTQVIEAGVDVSATTLFTELAPWASLVQRFGRCNRRGEQNEVASVRWIDLPANDADADKVRHPYDLADLQAAAEELRRLKDIGPGSLAAHRQGLSEKKQEALFPHRHTHVIRRKDLLDLFDTTPDLAGNDIDIDRYVREVEETDVRVFWRDYGDPEEGATPNDINGEGQTDSDHRVEPAPLRDELCPVPIGDFKAYTKNHRRRVWRWNFTEKVWEQANPDAVAPGQVFLVHVAAGGYSSVRGWSGDSDDKPTLEFVPSVQESRPPDANEEDPQTGEWQELAQHTDAVCKELGCVLRDVSLREDEVSALRHAARWHDVGKAHPVFQSGLPDGCPDRTKLWAKGQGKWKKYRRALDGRGEITVRSFRHELASALTVLDPTNKAIPDELRDLVAYLDAAHHGKVRLSIRSMPNEVKPRTGAGVPQPQKRFARGVWDGDMLPEVGLGGGITAPVVTLSLEPMELGLCETEPFAGEPSWIERVLSVRDRFGPFRLAYLEAILRAADERASAAANGGDTSCPK